MFINEKKNKSCFSDAWRRRRVGHKLRDRRADPNQMESELGTGLDIDLESKPGTKFEDHKNGEVD